MTAPPPIDLPAFPPDFDPAVYRAANPDLEAAFAGLSDAALRDHFMTIGRTEGRVGCPSFDRSHVAAIAAGAPSVLEFFPGVSATLSGPNVAYYNTRNQVEITFAYLKPGQPGPVAPPIDFVSAGNDLSIVPGPYALILSSHVVQIQPDLALHFKHLERLLEPGGVAVLFLPDTRYCFTHFVPVSTIGDVFEAAIEQRTQHSIRTLVNISTLIAHNDGPRHWRGDHGEPLHLDSDTVGEALAVAETLAINPQFVPAYAWQFTPDSFRDIIETLNGTGQVRLELVRLYETRRDQQEFIAVLRKPDTPPPLPASEPRPVRPEPLPPGTHLSGWVRDALDPECVQAHDRIDDPRLVRALDVPLEAGFNLQFTIEASRVETIRIRFDSNEAGVRRASINLFQPWLIEHDLPFLEVDADPASGRYVFDLDVPASPKNPADRIAISLLEDANLRIHCWALHPDMIITPSAPEGATLALRDVRVTPGAPARRGPSHGRLVTPLPAPRPAVRGAPRDAILLACWAPEQSLDIAEHTLASITRHHPDAKLFAGINHGSSPAWEQALRASGMDVEIRHVPATIKTNSDAAGFITAMDALRESRESFDLVWFGHTKGVSHPDWEYYRFIRWGIEKRFWSLRNDIHRIFENPRIGIYAPHLSLAWDSFNFDLRPLERIVDAPVPAFGLCATSTFYAMRHETVRALIDRAPARLFQEGVEAFGGTRWFFEWGFPSFPLMLGLDPWIPRGIGRTSLPETAEVRTLIWADERQNHALVRREYERYRRNPANYQLAISAAPLEFGDLPKLVRPPRAIWIDDDQGARWTITAS